MNTIDRIFNNLKQGKRYGYFMKNVRFPMYTTVLSMDEHCRFIRWTHFGSSANEATKNDLKWIITEIFKMSPEDFEKKYVIIPEEEK